MLWKLPPLIKIYEALSTLADNRITMHEDSAKITSSTGNKTYEVYYNQDTGEISANDNASFYKGYIGYPIIAFLMKKDMIEYKKKYALQLKGLHWKSINTEFSYDFIKSIQYVENLMKSTDIPEFHKYLKKVMLQLKTLKLKRPVKLKQPPKGY